MLLRWKGERGRPEGGREVERLRAAVERKGEEGRVMSLSDPDFCRGISPGSGG